MYASLFEQKVVPVKHSTKFRDESVMKSKRISKFLWVGALGSVVVVSGLAEKVYPGKVVPSSAAQTANSASTTGTSGYNVTGSTLAPLHGRNLDQDRLKHGIFWMLLQGEPIARSDCWSRVGRSSNGQVERS